MFSIIVDLSVKDEFKTNNYIKNSNSNNMRIATLTLLNVLLIRNILSITVLLVAFGAFLSAFLVINISEINNKT